MNPFREEPCAGETSSKSEAPSRCWRRPSRGVVGTGTVSLFTSVILALSVAGCMEENQEGPLAVCSTEQILVPLRGKVDVPTTRNKSGRLPAIWVTVHERYTTVSCGNGLESTVHPGHTLATFRADDSGVIAADLERTVLVTEQMPSTLDVTVLFDEDDDGVCDQGEQTGYTQVADDGTIGELGDLHMGCPGRA